MLYKGVLSVRREISLLIVRVEGVCAALRDFRDETYFRTRKKQMTGRASGPSVI